MKLNNLKNRRYTVIATPAVEKWSKLFYASLFLLASCDAYAQAEFLPRPGQDINRSDDLFKKQQQQREIERQLEKAREQMPDRAAPATSPSLNLGGQAFQIDKIDVINETVNFNGPFYLTPILERYEHTKMDQEKIFSLLKELNAFYYQHGFATTFATLHAQNISHGELKIEIEWGRIKGWIFNGKELPDGALRRRLEMAFPNAAGRILNVRDIDNTVEILRGNGGDDVKIDIVPSEEKGYSYLRVQASAEAVRHYSLNIDNSGTTEPNYGLYKINPAFSVFNMLSLNETLSLSGSFGYYAHPSNYASNLAAASISIPYGYWSLEGAYSQSYYRNVLTGIYGSYLTRGSVEDTSVKLSNILTRWQGGKVTLYGKLATKSTKNYIDDMKLSVSSNLQTQASIGSTFVGAVLNGAAYGDLYIGKGIRSFGASQFIIDTENSPKFDYVKTNASISWSRSFLVANREVNYALSSSAQYSDDRLPATYKMTLGDQYTVRGFKDQSIQGDKGIFVGNTLTTPLKISITDSAKIDSGFVGLDIGWARNINEPSQVISGASTGLRFSLNQSVTGSATISVPLRRPDQFKAGLVAYVGMTLAM